MLWYSFRFSISLYCKRIESIRHLSIRFVYLLLINVYHDLLAFFFFYYYFFVVVVVLFSSCVLLVISILYLFSIERKLIEINTKQLNVVCWLVLCLFTWAYISISISYFTNLSIYLSFIDLSLFMYMSSSL